MNNAVTIERIAQVLQIQMVVEASDRDSFAGTFIQDGVLPFVFYYGDSRVIRHQCLKCALIVEAEAGYGSKEFVSLGRLSRQGFHENRAQLDVVGRLFDQYLHHEIDSNGFETYLYQISPDDDKGAVLSVAYYRCNHCQTQYLVLYQNQFKEHIPPFEPDEILIEKIYQVAFDHDELLRVLNKTVVPTAT